MLTDNEIRGIAEDSLEFEAFAKTLEKIITTSETPITIGVYGAWGSGKTSLMRMTKERLEKGDKIKTVWFDAWKFDRTYDLRVALIHAILMRMKEDATISSGLKVKVKKLLKRVNWLGLGKAAFSSFIPQLAIWQGKEPLLKNQGKTLELIGDFEEEFKDIIKDYVGDKGQMVVFIDDLDRCISEKTIDILEALKLFLNVPHSVFVIGADKTRIEDGIIERYGGKSEGWAGNYLEKIVQIPFKLPPLRKKEMEEFINGFKDIPNEIKTHATILAEVGNNPRRIKRLLNSFELKTILAEEKELFNGTDGIKKDIMAKLAVIEFRWPDFYTDLVGKYIKTKKTVAEILRDSKSEEKLKGGKSFIKYLEDAELKNFLDDEPQLKDVNMDLYIYLAQSTTEVNIKKIKEIIDYLGIHPEEITETKLKDLGLGIEANIKKIKKD